MSNQNNELYIILPGELIIREAFLEQKKCYTHWLNNYKGKPNSNKYFSVEGYQYSITEFDPLRDGHFHIPLTTATYEDLFLLIPGNTVNTNRYLISENFKEINKFLNNFKDASIEFMKAKPGSVYSKWLDESPADGTYKVAEIPTLNKKIIKTLHSPLNYSGKLIQKKETKPMTKPKPKPTITTGVGKKSRRGRPRKEGKTRITKTTKTTKTTRTKTRKSIKRESIKRKPR